MYPIYIFHMTDTSDYLDIPHPTTRYNDLMVYISIRILHLRLLECLTNFCSNFIWDAVAVSRLVRTFLVDEPQPVVTGNADYLLFVNGLDY